MAVLDLADVTRSLITLLRQSFVVSPAWTMAIPAVLPEPPNRLTGDGIGLYLYHVQENTVYSNFPTDGSDRPPVRFLPMALNLYYQLSAHNTADPGAFNEQLLMSVAMKAFHDYPFIDDNTQVNSITVFEPAIRGKDNRFKVMLQPIVYNEAVNNWTSGEVPIRLSAYYEVSVVFLEPEETRTYSGRVLSYGNYIFTEGPPRITNTQNILRYVQPPNNVNAEVKIQPAQVPPGDNMDIFGVAFGGDSITLRLLQRRWARPAIADAAWNLTRTGDNQLTVTVQQTAIEETTVGPPPVVDILPGMYSCQVIVNKTIILGNGEVKTFRNISNQFPFTVTPAITNINRALTIVTVTGYIFQHPQLPPEDILVYIGEIRIMPDDNNALAPGEFEVTAVNQLRINLPTALTTGQLYPVRIIIAGAESPPGWITAP